MSAIGDVWDWTKNATDFVLDATEDVADVLSGLGDALEDLGAVLGFGPKGDDKVRDEPISPIRPATWPPWVWVGVAALAVLVLAPVLKKALR